ncbi:MAG: response regulator [Mesorhizobium sp.]|nr:MAG: response regulator [Mesorhizobium sp.]
MGPRSNYRRCVRAAIIGDMAGQRIRVAVVDDDDSVRRALARVLRSASIEVSAYGSGAELLKSVGTAEHDYIILDLHMPDLNGFDVLRHLARLRHPCPVIVMTGHDSPKARAECLALGAVKYMPKPLDADLLVTAITLTSDPTAAPER